MTQKLVDKSMCSDTNNIIHWERDKKWISGESNAYLPNPSARAEYDTRSIFSAEFLQVWIQSIPSPRLVASPKLKNTVCPTIYP